MITIIPNDVELQKKLIMDLSFYLNYYLYFLISEFQGAPFVIKVTVILVSILLVIFLFSLTQVFLLNFGHHRRDKAREDFITAYWEKVEQVVTSPTFYDEVEFEEFMGINHGLYKNNKKQIFTETLIDILKKNKLKGIPINQSNLLLVLDHFQLPAYWQKIVLTGSIRQRKHALRYMDELGHLLSGAILLKSVYHKNKDFRKQARAALIQYDQHDPFKFLEESFDTEFNALDEIRLHHYLVHKAKTSELPLFTRWVKNAKSDEFKIFIIKEIGLLKQVDCARFLADRLNKESNVFVKKQIIETLGVLRYTEADTKLIAMYSTAQTILQKAIIETLSQLKTPTTLEFLAKTYEGSHDSSMKIQLAYALSTYGDEAKNYMQTLSLSMNDFDRKVFDQVYFKHEQPIAN